MCLINSLIDDTHQLKPFCYRFSESDSDNSSIFFADIILQCECFNTIKEVERLQAWTLCSKAKIVGVRAGQAIGSLEH